jgi:hypothetical protein
MCGCLEFNGTERTAGHVRPCGSTAAKATARTSSRDIGQKEKSGRRVGRLCFGQFTPVVTYIARRGLAALYPRWGSNPEPCLCGNMLHETEARALALASALVRIRLRAMAYGTRRADGADGVGVDTTRTRASVGLGGPVQAIAGLLCVRVWGSAAASQFPPFPVSTSSRRLRYASPGFSWSADAVCPAVFFKMRCRVCYRGPGSTATKRPLLVRWLFAARICSGRTWSQSFGIGELDADWLEVVRRKPW